MKGIWKMIDWCGVGFAFCIVLAFAAFVILIGAEARAAEKRPAEKSCASRVTYVYTMTGCYPCHRLVDALEDAGAKIVRLTTRKRPAGTGGGFPTVYYKDAAGKITKDNGGDYWLGRAGVADNVTVLEWDP